MSQRWAKNTYGIFAYGLCTLSYGWSRPHSPVPSAKGIRLNLGGSVLDHVDPVGRLLFNVLAMLAEFEADLISARTIEGMKVAKAKGRLQGKKPKLSSKQEEHLVSLYRAGEYITAELAELFDVARSTVYRAVGRSGGSEKKC